MKKNGKYFSAIISRNQYKPSVWDPYLYRDTHGGNSLSQFVTVQRAGQKAQQCHDIPFEPIEYKDILGGECLSFALRPNLSSNKGYSDLQNDRITKP